MAKALGLSENAHRGIAVLFLLFFSLGVLSASLYISGGELGNGLAVLGECSVLALLPAIIFLYIATRLAKERRALESLVSFLNAKRRTSVRDVSRQFGWTDAEAEERVVATLNENMVAGHFDRGTGEFFVSGGQQDYVLVENCKSCGASVGMWLLPGQIARCPYCGTDPRGASAVVAPQPAPPGQPQAVPTAGPPAAPAGTAPPAPVAMPPLSGAPAPGAPAAPTGPPGPVQYPRPPGQTSIAPTGPSALEVQSREAQGRKTTVRFMFFSMKPGAMRVAGLVLLGLGVLFLAAMVFMPSEAMGRGELLVCGALFYVPPLGIGAALAYKSYVHERYKAQLLDIADYLVTYRRIPFIVLARKMDLPEQTVRTIAQDILAFGLLQGEVSADGSEFSMSLRTGDVQTVAACPYCKHPAINITVIRGGGEKCPYCGSMVYFTEGVRR